MLDSSRRGSWEQKPRLDGDGGRERKEIVDSHDSAACDAAVVSPCLRCPLARRPRSEHHGSEVGEDGVRGPTFECFD